MKIFLSHQQVDSAAAANIAGRLRYVHSIESYLDVIDSQLPRQGEDIGQYLRREMGNCSHLLAVVSRATKESWWVPWEIGIATEKDYPLATYAGGYCELPGYLKKWPYLRSDSDIDKYAEAAKTATRRFDEQRSIRAASEARKDATRGFYTQLRASLGQ